MVDMGQRLVEENLVIPNVLTIQMKFVAVETLILFIQLLVRKVLKKILL
jgi:hypothetical protein